jgi:hypothetical protein
MSLERTITLPSGFSEMSNDQILVALFVKKAHGRSQFSKLLKLSNNMYASDILHENVA